MMIYIFWFKISLQIANEIAKKKRFFSLYEIQIKYMTNEKTHISHLCCIFITFI